MLCRAAGNGADFSEHQPNVSLSRRCFPARREEEKLNGVVEQQRSESLGEVMLLLFWLDIKPGKAKRSEPNRGEGSE